MCVIGMERPALLPLIIFDLVVNVGITSQLFVTHIQLWLTTCLGLSYYIVFDTPFEYVTTYKAQTWWHFHLINNEQVSILLGTYSDRNRAWNYEKLRAEPSSDRSVP